MLPRGTDLGSASRLGFVLLLGSAFLYLVDNNLPSTPPNSLFQEDADVCVPCRVGDECRAGCLTKEGIRKQSIQMKQIQEKIQAAQAAKAKIQAARAAKPLVKKGVLAAKKRVSIALAKKIIEGENEGLLHLNKNDRKGLGGVLDSVQRSMLRAEAAEVQMRRQADLHKGVKETITDAYHKMSPAEQRLFRLRAREFELALHEAERAILTSENVMDPIANARISRPAAQPKRPNPAAAPAKKARMQSMAEESPVQRMKQHAQTSPSWTSAMRCAHFACGQCASILHECTAGWNFICPVNIVSAARFHPEHS